jgi:pyrroloquinoline quinone biosynthesis protein E
VYVDRIASPIPVALLAELTYRCPLRCPYCSNPLELAAYRNELSTEGWLRVIEEAAALGVLHIHFSGGEPLLRADLPRLVAAAHEAELYSNLITSATLLTRSRAEALRAAGLDSVQISFQAEETELANGIAGTPAHARKLEAAALTKELGWPLTINVVIHRLNIDHIPSIISFAEGLGAERLELAHTQYYGWGLRNREALLPSAAQIEAADVAVREARSRLGNAMHILHVVPDYYAEYPKPCMNGWGSTHLTVVPTGQVLPCPAASAIRTLQFDNVREHSLAWIWRESPSFNAYRGEGWMQQPCRTCPRRTLDFGGCRCQAFLLAGDAAVADPVCHLSPHHRIVEEWRAEANREHVAASHGATTTPPIVLRQMTANGLPTEALHRAP